MNPEFATELIKTMMFQAVALASPILVTAMVVGLGISLFQAVTTIHEQTLTFVPKALAIVGVLVVSAAVDAPHDHRVHHRRDREDAADGVVVRGA
jgi:flagellar biosynthetic protein FliQ